MPTIRLYRAVKEHQNVKAVVEAATQLDGRLRPIPLQHDCDLMIRLRAAQVELQLALDEAQPIVEGNTSQRANALRISMEQDICRFMVKSLCEQGYALDYDDYDDSDFHWTKNWEVIAGKMFDTDACHIHVRGDDTHDPIGWIRLVYGNEGYDVISNYTTNLEPLLKPTFEYIKKYYDSDYPL